MDIPAHVVNPTVVTNHVLVQGGTNWDLSRSAVETPLYPAAPVVPAAQKPAYTSKQLFMKVHFLKGSAAVPKDIANFVKMLPKGSTVALGTIDAVQGSKTLFAKRKAALVAVLNKEGYNVNTEENIFSTKEINEKTLSSVEIYVLK